MTIEIVEAILRWRDSACRAIGLDCTLEAISPPCFQQGFYDMGRGVETRRYHALTTDRFAQLGFKNQGDSSSAYGSLRRIALRIPDQEPTSTSIAAS